MISAIITVDSYRLFFHGFTATGAGGGAHSVPQAPLFSLRA